MHKWAFESMHEVHSFCYVKHHFMPLLKTELHTLLFLVKNLKQRATSTKLGDDDRVSLVSGGAHEKY